MSDEAEFLRTGSVLNDNTPVTASSDGAAPDVPTEQDGALIEAMFAALYPEDGVWYLDVMRERQRVHERLSAALAVARPVIAAESKAKVVLRLQQRSEALRRSPEMADSYGAGVMDEAIALIRSLPLLTEETDHG